MNTRWGISLPLRNSTHNDLQTSLHGEFQQSKLGEIPCDCAACPTHTTSVISWPHWSEFPANGPVFHQSMSLFTQKSESHCCLHNELNSQPVWIHPIPNNGNQTITNPLQKFCISRLCFRTAEMKESGSTKELDLHCNYAMYLAELIKTRIHKDTRQRCQLPGPNGS